MAKWVFLNGGLIREEAAFIHFKDLAFQRGYGIFDFFRLKGHEPLFLNDHLERFYFSAQGMHLQVPMNPTELKSAIYTLIERNNQPHTGIRLSLTGGTSEDGFSIGEPTLLISQHAFAPPTAEQMENGIRLLSYPYQRPLPQFKTIDYLMAVWLQPLKNEKKADDILYHHNGLISECPRSNFFLVTGDNRLLTPAENALGGITRKKLLELARKYYTVEERPVHFNELQTAREVFITSTTKQILPVAQIDDLVFRERKQTHQLLRLFRQTWWGE